MGRTFAYGRASISEQTVSKIKVDECKRVIVSDNANLKLSWFS